jgi:hypothetical protein
MGWDYTIISRGKSVELFGHKKQFIGINFGIPLFENVVRNQ